MATYENVLVEDRGPVRVITLNRAAKKNAFNIALATDTTHALNEANADAQVRVIVLTASGDTFSAGVDLKMFSQMSGGGDVSMVTTIEQTLLRLQKPILAAVNGRAVGMGVTLLPFFDMVYAAEEATFATPFVKLGIVMEYGSSYLLPRLIGRQRTNELILRAAPIDAVTAEKWGLVTRVFPKAALLEETVKTAQEIAGNGPEAVRKCRELISQGQNSTLQESIEREWQVLMTCYTSQEFMTSIMNFMNRPK